MNLCGLIFVVCGWTVEELIHAYLCEARLKCCFGQETVAQLSSPDNESVVPGSKEDIGTRGKEELYSEYYGKF